MRELLPLPHLPHHDGQIYPSVFKLHFVTESIKVTDTENWYLGVCVCGGHCYDSLFMWVVGLWDWLAGVMWTSLEQQASKALEHSKESLKSHFGGDLMTSM